jgi:hypothetical protein
MVNNNSPIGKIKISYSVEAIKQRNLAPKAIYEEDFSSAQQIGVLQSNASTINAPFGSGNGSMTYFDPAHVPPPEDIYAIINNEAYRSVIFPCSLTIHQISVLEVVENSMYDVKFNANLGRQLNLKVFCDNFFQSIEVSIFFIT